MAGFLSLFSGGHRRPHTSADARTGVSNTAELSSSGISGNEVACNFKPVEHPAEPQNRDQPVICPLPEPSILNDGRMWKERLSASSNLVNADQQAAKEGSLTDPQASQTRRLPVSSKLVLLSSVSAPEHDIINMLEECNADKL